MMSPIWLWIVWIEWVDWFELTHTLARLTPSRHYKPFPVATTDPTLHITSHLASRLQLHHGPNVDASSRLRRLPWPLA